MNYPKIRSIRTLSAFGVFASTILFALFTYLFVTYEAKQNLLIEFDALLVNYSLDLRQNFVKGHNYSIFDSEEEEGSLEDKIFPFPHGKALIELVDLDGLVIARSASLSDTTLPDGQDMSSNLSLISFSSFDRIEDRNQKKHYRMTRIPIENDSDEVLGTLWVAVPTDFIDVQQKRLSNKLLLIFPPFVLISMLVSYLISQMINSAILKLSNEIKSVKIDLKHVSIKVPQWPLEIHDLSASFNLLIQELKKANQWQEEFFMNAAHQLKTPLFIIKNEIDELAYSNGENFNEQKNKLSKRVMNLSKVLQKLLDFGRADHRFTQEQLTEGYLVDIITEIIIKINPLAERKKVHIELEASQVTNAQFIGELTLVEQAIQNILDNAIKWTPESSHVLIRITENETHLFVKIYDEGPGVSEELKDKIFLPFSGEETADGTGLGLALVKRVAQLHGGDVCYLREEGKTCFSFSLSKKRELVSSL